MKICLISNLFPPYVLGGAELQAKKIAQLLAEDHEVVVFGHQFRFGVRQPANPQQHQERHDSRTK